MSRRVLVDDYQEVTGPDLTNPGLYDQQARDAIVADGITFANRYAGCLVSSAGPATIGVAAGRCYTAGQVYYRDTATAFTLTTNLPNVVQRMATVVVYGAEIDTDLQPRDYIVNETTGEAEARTGPRERRRALQMDVVYGSESTNPQRGIIGAGIVPVADVVLSPTGIVTIAMIEATRVPSGEDNRAGLVALQDFRDTAGRRLDGYASDIAALREGQVGIPDPTNIRRMQMDIARLKRTVRIPQTNVGYHFDYFIDAQYSNPADAAYVARIDYGVRFANAAERYAPPALLNPTEPKVTRTGSFVLPAWAENVRISCVGNDAQVSAADNQYQTTTMVQRSVSRSSVSYGPTVTTCTNAAEFQVGTYNAATQTLAKNGEQFAVAFTGRDFGAEAGIGAGTHLEINLSQIQTFSWTETYWDAVTTTTGVNGSICAQTFLNANAGWLVGFNLYFSQVDVTAGSVTLAICNVTAAGTPDYASVIGLATVPAANLKVYPSPTRFPFTPVFLEQGKRYAAVPVTSGHHFLAQTTNNKFAQGSFFNSTDGAWFQGDTLKDLAFEAVFAQFAAARVEVDLQPLTLENGICNVKIITAGVIPNGCDLVYQYKPSGAALWTTVSGNLAAQPLYGLPALAQLRAVFIGTTDLMPGIDLAQGEVKTWRPRGDFTWVSKPFDLGPGVTTTSVKYTVRLEHFDPAHHTFAAQMKGAGGYVNPTTTTMVVDPYDATARTYTYTFTVPATQTYTFKGVGTTDAVTNNFIISQTFDAAA